MSQDRTKRKLTAILSTDVVGFSRLMEENESSTVRHLEENKNLISKLIEDYNGRVIDSPGDNMLAEFGSAVMAVDCAVKIQKELKIKNAELVENRRMLFRIGINLGDVIEEEGRLYGNGVNIAARLEGLAKPGGICISRHVYDQVKSKLDLGYEYSGEHSVKNISEPIWVYNVLIDAEHAGKVIGEKKRSGGISSRITITAVLIILVAGITGWILSSNRPEEQTIKTIAVLPFDNQSTEKDQAPFVDGLTDEIINYLSNISGLQVTSKTSSFAFKNTKKTIQEIAEILDREYILEGSVRKDGNTLRITAQLIHAQDDRHLWSDAYECEFKDIFKIQKDIANNVADKLKLTLNALQIGGTENIKAYELYVAVKGLNSALPSVDGLNRQLELLEEATNLDPDFASAWALKSFVHVKASVIITDQAYNELDKGLKAALKAIELQPRLGEAYLSLGLVYTKTNEYIKAGSAYRKGMKYTNKSTDYGEYMLTYHYAVVGYLEKGIEILEELWRNDPLRTDIGYFYIINLIMHGDIKNAEQEYEQLINKANDQPEISELKREISALILFNNDSTPVLCIKEAMKEYPDIAELIKAKESPEEMLSELHISFNNDNLHFLNIMEISIKAAYLGDSEFALEAMEKSYRLNNPNIWGIWLPVFKKERQLPRFKEFVKEIGLVDYWKEFGWPDLCHTVSDDDFVCD